MKKVTFTIDGIEGKFVCDADELSNYKTLKQFALAEKNPAGMFEALGRVFIGNDEEYVERVGGVDNIGLLNDSAINAVQAKKAQASSIATSGKKTK